MDVSAFIKQAIDRGVAEGPEALTGIERMVFLISEAEVLCDKDGIDSFIATYGRTGISQLADAYAAVGATEISSTLREIATSLPHADDVLLDRVTSLITARTAYDYDAIANAVVREVGDWS